MNKSDQPKVIVITLNYNQVKYTVDCINSLLKSVYDNFTIMLVDNGSVTKNFAELKARLPDVPNLIVERIEENIGYVGGINYAMSAADKVGGDYFLIMNNDTIIDAAAITELVECAEKHSGKAIVSGKVYNYDEKDTLQYIGQSFDEKGMLNQRSIVKGRREKDVGQYDEEMEMGMLDDIYWLLPRSVYEKIGPYSDFFFLYGEQNDYGFKALREGYRFIYTPKAKLWHKGGVTTCDGEKKSAKIEYWTTMAVFKLAILNFPNEKAEAFIKKWALRQIIKNFILMCLGKTKWDNFRCTFIAYRHFRYWNVIRYKDNGFNPFDK